MTHPFTHIDRMDSIQVHLHVHAISGLSAAIDRESVRVSVLRADDVFTKASWPKSTKKATAKTIFVTRGEWIPSDD